jgi:hypothetical protein
MIKYDYNKMLRESLKKTDFTDIHRRLYRLLCDKTMTVDQNKLECLSLAKHSRVV